MAEVVLTYPREALLTIDEMAAVLRVSVRTVERMDLPTVYCGPKNRRYLYGQILDCLAERAA